MTTREPADVAATRTAYDIVASDYAELLRDELDRKVLDRAMLAAFADLVPAGHVADVGCGPGRVTAHLAGLGLSVEGVDLSPGMISVARQEHPSLSFSVGSMEALDFAAGSLAGIVAWYSIIHTPGERLPALFAEFARVLAPGGLLLLAFQVGDEPRHISRGYGHDVSMDAYRLPVARIETLLTDAGFGPRARLVREPVAEERTPQAFLIAERPA
ncbi:class I SAM-dependent methyltransferase [Lacisediminihabitans changchengi]|uniref:Methyltransferase domain-containing protein n=1 Tax=Lacisediminihabitans changchengi TaxID=2787634 RepID=A0A934SG35_9MICO|nr:class I SAM-dependent methyltransferase [Lacisediminihabitans changchengi]MBK4346027.1 methyltransferase domain-containing protein [Lacisediminihabitans changchengi]